ncbi:collagenase 3-like [Schistocerca nitens]|uniref:collagenase 3-like n=1 Tax=Schistocerca nitens TaxID=7011 RepID=UPI0021193EED|nr:collagenase 3-like [Schistocerca nitens]
MKELSEIAFNTWKEHTDIIFEEDSSNYDIIISNKRRLHRKESSGQHYCPKRFDGKSGVLAHANYPNSNNDVVEIHMDQDEDWYFEIDTNTPKEKINFYAVLVHEIGHTLGIPHSAENTSIMYPLYNSSNIELSKDDILVVQSLYGKPVVGDDDDDEEDEETDDEEKDLDPPELCKLNNKIKNFLIVDQVLYIYYEKWVWIMDLDNLDVRTKPQLISDWLTFLPKGFNNITAAYQRPSGDVILFIDNKLYIMEIPSFRLKFGYPTSLTSLSLRKNVILHSAVNTYSGKSFIFFDDVYYVEIDECKGISKKYGRITKEFSGIPPGIESSFRYTNGLLYFIKDKTFYEYSEFTNSVVRAGKFDLSLFGIDCSKSTSKMLDIISNLKESLNQLENFN